MRIAIIEDNETEAKVLKEKSLRLLPESFGLTTIDLYSTASSFLNADLYYDLLLIDCLLPDLTGVELAKKIRETNTTTAFVFTTAYMDYAAEGYETNAMRYLLKPIEDNKLKEALLYFAHSISESSIVELTGTTRYATYVKTNDILYVEYVGRKIIVRLKEKSVESHKTMKEFENTLNPDFFYRTSQRFLVHFGHIIGKNNNVLIMENGEHVTISRRRLTPFNQAYIHFLKRG